MIAGDLSLNRTPSLSRGNKIRIIVIGAAFVIALALIFTFQPDQESLRLQAGQVSSKTILAPARVTFASEIQTREARAKGEAQIKDVYDPPDSDRTRDQLRWANRLLDYVDSIRHDPYSSPDVKLGWVQAIPTITLSVQTINRTLALDDNAYHRVVSETLYVLEVTMRNNIRPTDLAIERSNIPMRVTLSLPPEQAELVAQWVQALVVPNSYFNPVRTEEQRARARADVGTVYRTIEKGQAIVREGEVVSPLSIEALEAAGFVRSFLTAADYAGPALLAVLFAVFLALWIIHLRPAILQHGRTTLLIAFLVLAFAAGAKWVSGGPSWLVYLFPISAAAMLLSVLVDSAVALAAATILSLSFGFFVHGSLEFTLYALGGSLIAALSLGRIERLPALLWCGVYVAAANAAVVAIFRVLDHTTDPGTWVQLLAMSLGNGTLAGLFALGSLFVMGKVFGITTSIELLDLARPTHPLLKKLLVEAPGTYHHSLIVSQLAEQAAQVIGADSLLVRVAAYYHDVGKTGDPQSFVENQMEGVNIHDTLEPRSSAGIVIDHVARGIALAKQHRLPDKLRELIPQHHGTTVTAYFHRKAIKDKSNGAPVNENDFRYPGPKPQSREAAILMLADGVEATTRAERPATPEQIRAIIDRIVSERLRDGQLDESDLTLRDIQQIKAAFFGVLQGMFHPRVIYPEPEPTHGGGAPS